MILQARPRLGQEGQKRHVTTKFTKGTKEADLSHSALGKARKQITTKRAKGSKKDRP